MPVIFAPPHLPEEPDLIVCDVGFISLKLALPPALRLPASGCLPHSPHQAAVRGRPRSGRGLRHRSAMRRIHRKCAMTSCAGWLRFPQWRVMGLMPLPSWAADGNTEFLIAAEKDREKLEMISPLDRLSYVARQGVRVAWYHGPLSSLTRISVEAGRQADAGASGQVSAAAVEYRSICSASLRRCFAVDLDNVGARALSASP